MHIPRQIKSEVLKLLRPNKVIVIYGPRRTGKTTLLREIIVDIKEECLFLSGEDRKIHNWLGSQEIDVLKQNIGKCRLMVIDEAQKIDRIGLNLKLIVDHIPGMRVIATGSSSFELANQVGEPLVGRKWQFYLYPIAQLELQPMEHFFETKARLESRLIYGMYPEVITEDDPQLKKRLLDSIIDNHLYKDLLEFEFIRKSKKIIELLQMIAFQIGKKVSLNEIAMSLGINQRTVEKYFDLLEKVFVIKRVYGFSRNLRKEITKNSRFYFYDNGIRNALINNFNPFSARNDVGELWENYIFMERLKKRQYQNIGANVYFWRTYDQKEIDLIEEREGKLFGYELKWSSKKKAKPPKDWLGTYKNAEYSVINPENYVKFIS